SRRGNKIPFRRRIDSSKPTCRQNRCCKNGSDHRFRFPSGPHLRQRERFYHAESLKNFARDTVPAGTFDALQDEIYHGVIDVCEDYHLSGFARMKETMKHATTIAVTSNPLVTSIKTQDRQGICHQLANDDRLIWVPDNES
ncbi:hypothetical protein Q7I60_18615, partial [Escherichia coli]